MEKEGTGGEGKDGSAGERIRVGKGRPAGMGGGGREGGDAEGRRERAVR